MKYRVDKGAGDQASGPESVIEREALNMNREKMMDIIEDLEDIMNGLESEVKIRIYCAANGLDPESASDYARAACAAIGYHQLGSARGRLRVGNSAADELLNSNRRALPVAEAGSGCYNDDETIERLYSLYKRVDALGSHGFWGDLKEKAKKWLNKGANLLKGEKKGKEEVKGIIVNQSGDTIGVAGMPWEGVYDTFKLRSGHSSDEILSDADAVVIFPGQKYYKPYTNQIVTEGAIKIRDWSKWAKVINVNGVLRVDAVGAQYFDKNKAKGYDWD